jgi:hypothetical protein
MDHITSSGNMINVVTPGVVRRPDQHNVSINNINNADTNDQRSGRVRLYRAPVGTGVKSSARTATVPIFGALLACCVTVQRVP